jgi:hypothetical protein
MRGRIDEAGYRREIAVAREAVQGLAEPHWAEYLAAWPLESGGNEGGKADPPSTTSLEATAPLEEAVPLVDPVAIVETTTTITETTIYIDSSSIRA